MLVSAVIPCLNEERHIAACLDSIIAGDYPKDSLEVLVVDGMSADQTRRVVQSYVDRHVFVRLLENPRRITPVAMNIGIREAKGDAVIVMGAHTVYPTNYISGLMAWLQKTNADAVGGVCVTQPANETPTARAIAIGLSHRFGVGNSHFRVGVSQPRWVDTVAFGCYRRDVFDRVGLFDEDLARNQDDEFNLRLLRRGGRILLVPDVVSRYYARDSLSKLWRMFYQYGVLKPLVALKVGGILTVRQAVPPAFVASLLTSGGLALWWSPMRLLLGLILLTYAAGAIAAARSTARRHGVRCALLLCIVFVVLHVSYGLGFLYGGLRCVIRGPNKQRSLRPLRISR